MQRIHERSGSFDYEDLDAAIEQMKACNAFERSDIALPTIQDVAVVAAVILPSLERRGLLARAGALTPARPIYMGVRATDSSDLSGNVLRHRGNDAQPQKLFPPPCR